MGTAEAFVLKRLAAVDLPPRMGIIAAHQGQSARPPDADSRIHPRVMPAMSPEPVETVEVTTVSVACDGGPGAAGHPKVFLNLAKDGQIDCPYCGKRFVLKAGANTAAH
jgi:uncharacterized Zn-finger protein